MMRLACLSLIAALLAGCASHAVRIASRPLGDQLSDAPERYIVAAVDNPSTSFMARAGSSPRGYGSTSVYGPSAHALAILHALETDYGLREINAWPIEALGVHCAVLELPAGADRAAMIERLSHDRRVRISQPLQTFATRTDPYNDPYVGLQHGFEEMDVAAAHPLSRGEGVRVAIIDTGVDTDHPDLKGAIAGAANFVDADDAQFRHDRHGTEMAGVIAAVANNREGIVGVAPGARLLVYKACWQARADADAARCNSFTLARALAAAYDAHAQIVNMSLAGPDDPLLGQLIREGVKRGVLFVGAATRDGAGKTGLMHRAGVIEVASAGSPPDIDGAVYAPGSEILTLLPGGHYDFATGTSIATAQVSGVIALMVARNPALTPSEAYQVLRDTSSAGQDPGIRRVDACAAIVGLTHRGSCRSADLDRKVAAGQADRLAHD